ncbi:MAG: hypothetical protein ACE3JK_02630 [Sporolactobacillus sp.]
MTVIDNGDGTNGLRITNAATGTGEKTQGSSFFTVQPSTKYIVSLKMRSSANCTSIDLFFLGRKIGSTVTGSNFDYIHNFAAVVKPSTSYTTYTYTFTTNSDEISGYIRCDNNSSTDGNNSTADFSLIKMQTGDKATPWTPAAADQIQKSIPYKGVAIDDNGLTAVAGSTTVNVDSSNGFKITAGSTTKFQVDTSGNFNMQGNITAGNISGVNFTGSSLTLAGTLNVTGAISAASEGVILNSNGIAITKGSLNLQNTQIAADGTLTTKNANITGTITVSGKAPDDSYASILKISPSTNVQPLTIDAPDDPSNPSMIMSAYLISAQYTDTSDPGANNIIKASFTPEQINLSEHPDDGTANGGNGVSSNLSASSFSVIDNSYNTGLTYSQPSGLFELWKNGGIIFQAGSDGIEIGQPGSTPFIDFHGSGDIGNRDYDGRLIYQNGLMNADGCDFRTEKNLKVDGGTVYSSGGVQVQGYAGKVQLIGRSWSSSGSGANADVGSTELTALDGNGNWQADMALGYDDTGGRVWSGTIYGRTYPSSDSPNMYITSSGTIGRSTSSRRYKDNISYPDLVGIGEKILTLKPAAWYDRIANESLAREIETGVGDADSTYIRQANGTLPRTLKLMACRNMLLTAMIRAGNEEWKASIMIACGFH